MTGSPIFKIKSELKKRRNEHICRKLDLSLVRQTRAAANETEEFREELFCGPESAVTATSAKTNCAKSIRSSVSSFVFADKKHVKRKLDFDATDNGSDEVSSLRFSGKNVTAFYGFQSKHSSVLDGRSLPENVSSTYSPNKMGRWRRRPPPPHHRFSVGSYSRSSMTGSVVNCRRRLFSESVEELTQRKKRKPPPSSPVICQRKKEIKLSLQKRFPGVPNSDSARSGLLLNLAFSKYNLPANPKESNLSVNFINNDAVSSVVKKDMAQYSQLKQAGADGTSYPHSPVFAAIKKVRRRLNLEERNCTWEEEKEDVAQHAAFADSVVRDKTDLTNILVNSQHNKDDKVAGNINIVDEDQQSNGKSDDTNSRLKVKKDQVIHSNNTTTTVTIQPCSPCGGGGGGGGGGGSGSGGLFLKKAADHHPVRCKDIGAGVDGKEEFFKNSKLRSMLKNRILKLARTEDSVCEESLLVENDDGAGEDDVVGVQANESPTVVTIRNRSSKRTAKIICGQNGIRSNAEKEDHCRTHKKKSTAATNYWLKENSFLTDPDSFVEMRRPLRRRQSTLSSSKLFIRSHMERFLKDCLVVAAAEQPPAKIIDDDDNDKDNGNSKKDQLRNYDERSGVGDRSSGKIGASDTITEEEDRHIIENDSSESVLRTARAERAERAECVIENVLSQDEEKECKEIEKVSIESVASQALNERHHNEKIQCDRINSTNLKCEGRRATTTSVGVSYSCVRFSAPLHTLNDPNSDEVYDDATQKFRKKRKPHNPDNLISRLDKLCNREKSSSRMWQYEISKKQQQQQQQQQHQHQQQIYVNDDNNNNNNSSTTPSAAVFEIEKMWKEYSHLILLCSSHEEQASENSCGENSLYESGEISSFGINVCNSVVIILEREYCPNNLTYSSVFQLFPPWNILRFGKKDPIIILKPTKMVVMLEKGKAQAYRDPTLPNIRLANKGKIFCQCLAATAGVCNCILPNGYSTLMKPLFLSNINVFDGKNFTRERQYDALEKFNSTIADTLIKYKLYAVRRICLDLRILHLYENNWSNELRFLHIISLNESNETCCILLQGEPDQHPSIANINEEVTFTFSGLIPWKLIPIKNMPLFIEYINFVNVPNEVSEKIRCNPMMIFVLSKKHGSVMRKI